MSEKKPISLSSFESLISDVRDTIKSRHTRHRSIHKRLQIINEQGDLKIQIRDIHGTPNGITISERPNENQAWRRTSINLGMIGTAGEVQVSLPSDGVHPRQIVTVQEIGQLSAETTSLLERGLELL